MKNSICIVCNKEFEPRAGKKYCSNKCMEKARKQKEHLQTIPQLSKNQKLSFKSFIINLIHKIFII